MSDTYVFEGRNGRRYANSRRRSALVILCCTMLAIGLICAALFAGLSCGVPLLETPAAIAVAKTNKAPDAVVPAIHDGRVLKLVHTVFRHGPRTPADTYPTDPHINQTFAPFGWGHLTNEGKKYMYETGKWLERRYGQWLGEYYQPDAIWAQTTGVTRTQMSMALVLAGLLPPKGTEMEWNPMLNWQPVPIFAEPLNQDSLLLVRTPCPRYHEAIEDLWQTPAMKAITADNAALYKELSTLTGMSIANPDDVQSLYSTLRAEQEYGLELPKWTEDYYPERLLPLTEKSYMWNVHTDEMKKLKAGPFVGKMMAEWRARAAGKLEPAARKMFLYTGHDSTIVNVLHALDVWQQQLPVYGIMAVFELLEDRRTHEWGVQIWLRSSETTDNEAVPLTIPGCEHFCPLEKLEQLTSKLRTVNWAAECEARNKDFTEPPPAGP